MDIWIIAFRIHSAISLSCFLSFSFYILTHNCVSIFWIIATFAFSNEFLINSAISKHLQYISLYLCRTTKTDGISTLGIFHLLSFSSVIFGQESPVMHIHFPMLTFCLWSRAMFWYIFYVAFIRKSIISRKYMGAHKTSCLNGSQLSC